MTITIYSWDLSLKGLLNVLLFFWSIIVGYTFTNPVCDMATAWAAFTIKKLKSKGFDTIVINLVYYQYQFWMDQLIINNFF